MRIGIVLAFVALFALLAHNAVAQINSGMITGVVTDQQKAVIPNAKVKVVEDATHYSYSAVTNGSGEYTIPYLKAGAYSVTITAVGFPPFRLNGVNVVTEGTARADIEMRLASTSTEITVSANADQMQADSTTVESSVSSHIIDAVPNVTQNPL